MAKIAHFSAGFFSFLRDLAKNNDREWFKANQERYETQVKGPLLGFIGDLSKGLHKLSSHFNADPRPVGGSMFRIHATRASPRTRAPTRRTSPRTFPTRRAGVTSTRPVFTFTSSPGPAWAAAVSGILIRPR